MGAQKQGQPRPVLPLPAQPLPVATRSARQLLPGRPVGRIFIPPFRRGRGLSRKQHTVRHKGQAWILREMLQKGSVRVQDPDFLPRRSRRNQCAYVPVQMPLGACERDSNQRTHGLYLLNAVTTLTVPGPFPVRAGPEREPQGLYLRATRVRTRLPVQATGSPDVQLWT